MEIEESGCCILNMSIFKDNIFTRFIKSFIGWPGSPELSDMMMDMTDEEVDCVKKCFKIFKEHSERIRKRRKITPFSYTLHRKRWR